MCGSVAERVKRSVRVHMYTRMHVRMCVGVGVNVRVCVCMVMNDKREASLSFNFTDFNVLCSSSCAKNIQLTSTSIPPPADATALAFFFRAAFLDLAIVMRWAAVPETLGHHSPHTRSHVQFTPKEKKGGRV